MGQTDLVGPAGLWIHVNLFQQMFFFFLERNVIDATVVCLPVCVCVCVCVSVCSSCFLCHIRSS